MKSYGGEDENINNWRWIWISWCNIRNIKNENFVTTIVTDGGEEYEALSGIYDLILLDVMLPKKDGLKLNLDICQICCKDNSITINGKEMELLQLLIVNKNQVLNRELITSKIWGYDSDAEYNNVEVYISFIRKKLKLLNANVKIKSVREIRYKLEATDSSSK